MIVPDLPKYTRIKNPGRRGMREILKAKPLPTEFMKNAPDAVAQDKQFFMMFQKWVNRGRSPADPLLVKMRKRFNEVVNAGV